MPGPESPYDPLDHDPSGSGKRDFSLLWILLPVILVFLAMMGSNLWHLVQGDYTGFAIQQQKSPSGH